MGEIESVEIKKKELKLELLKKGTEQNKDKIRRLRKSIKRNLKINQKIKRIANKRKR